MSHILLKQIPSSSISTPTSVDIKVFSNFDDNGILYYVDDLGNKLPVGYGVNNQFVTTTYSDLYNLYTGSGFATGSHYMITDFYTIYEQPDFYFDGTLKSEGVTKTSPVRPLLVFAQTNTTLSPIATQPGYPNDKIIYDISWNRTEFNNAARGRITERIDDKNNRTDYDHRVILFRRYKNYTRDTLSTGSITDWNCITGEVTGSSTLFTSELVNDDIIIIDSKSDVGYDIGLKVISINSDTSMLVKVDSLYSGGVPLTVTLYNSTSQIIPTNYSFSSKSYSYWVSVDSGQYDSYKEIYFGQSDDNNFDEYYTFTTDSYNNRISNYSKYFIGSNNVLSLSNNVFLDDVNGNVINGSFYYNTIKSQSDNNLISGNMYGNVIYKLSNNYIMNSFFNNITNNSSNFRNNRILCEVSEINLSNSTHIYATYSCEIFSNSSNIPRLSYYDSSDVLKIGNITD